MEETLEREGRGGGMEEGEGLRAGLSGRRSGGSKL